MRVDLFTILFRVARARRCDSCPRRARQKKTCHGERGTHRGRSTSESPGRGAKGESDVPAELRSHADQLPRRRRTRRPRAARARPAAGAPSGSAVQPPLALELPVTFTVSAAVDVRTPG